MVLLYCGCVRRKGFSSDLWLANLASLNVGAGGTVASHGDDGARRSASGRTDKLARCAQCRRCVGHHVWYYCYFPCPS